MHFKTAWSDYFSVSYSNNYNSQLYNERQTPSGTAVYVSNCLFRSFTSGSAGALYFYSSAQYLLVESTSFFSCKTSNCAAAIYFYNTNNGQCVLQEVCCYDCWPTANSDPQVTYIRVNDSPSSKNYVNYSSFSRSFPSGGGPYYTTYHYYGKICCSSVNISINKCYHTSGIYCQPSSDSSSSTCSLTYSTFADNIATGCICIYLLNSGAKHEIKSCNILRNTQGTLGSEGTIYAYGNLMIEYSCILENTANNIFFQGHSSYTITLSNCTVDSTSNNGYLTTRNTVTKSFILALNHMSTRNCHSEYDSAGYLTAFIQTPSSSNKPIICYTYFKFIHQCQLSDKFSLINILIFNFIHSKH
jgi:hypothetical protein